MVPPPTSQPLTSSTTAPADEESAVPDDACALLEDLDLVAVLGEEPGEPAPGPNGCIIRAANPDSHARIHVGFQSPGGAAAYERQNEILGIDAPLEGIGDEAVRAGVRVHARKGDAFFFVQVVRFIEINRHIEDDELEEVARTIAAAAGW